MLNKKNYKLYGSKLYRNPIFSDKEFEKDLKIIKRIAGKIEKWGVTGRFPVRLTYNNFIIACNCFGLDYVSKVLYLLSDEKNHHLIMTFLYTVAGLESNIKVNSDLIIKFDKTKINRVLEKKIREGLKNE